MMDRLPRNPRLAGALLGLLLVFAAAGSFAAGLTIPGIPKADAPAEAKATAPEPIAASDIPARADEDERFAQAVISRTRSKDATAKMGGQLDDITTGTVNLSKTFEKEDLKQLSAIRLESLESHWKFYDRQLRYWRDELDRATSPFIADAAELAKRRAAWDATRASLASGGANSALVDRADVILGQIRLAEQALAGPMDAQFQLRRRANTVQASIDAGTKGIDAAIAYYDRRLGMVDAVPVWQAWDDTQFSTHEMQGVAAGLRLETAFVEEWGKTNQHRMRGYKAASALLLPLLLFLAYRNRRMVKTEPDMQAAARVLGRPISAWLLLSLVGVVIFFPDAPLVMHQIALLLALIPVLRLLPQKLYDVLGPWPYLGTALYLFYRMSFVLLGQPLYYRLYILAVAVLAAAAVLWLLYSSRRRRERAGATPASGLATTGGWLAVIALLVAVGANVVGNVSLAEMLTSGVLDSAYVGLALYAGASVLASVLSMLLARRVMTRFRVITQHAGPLLSSATKLIMVAATVFWVVVVFDQFRVARPLFAFGREVLNYPLAVGQISITLGSILLFVFSVYVAFWVARTVRVILRDEVLPNMELPRGVGNSISSLSYYALILIGLLVSLAAAGFETSQFALIFGALSVGIGFGLQNVVNNFVSGLILMFERPIQPGDVVEVSGTSGKVREIGMRATTLTTFEGADVIVPNGTLLSEKLINWTLSDMNRRIDVEVGVAYGSDPRRVMALLSEVALGTPGITPEPAPAIVFKGFGASSLDFGIRAWTNDFGDWVTIRTEMTARVCEALAKEGIEIPIPQQAVHLRSVAPGAGRQLAEVAPVEKDAPRPT
jgi:small-conductance mechanosensitive channel